MHRKTRQPSNAIKLEKRESLIYLSNKVVGADEAGPTHRSNAYKRCVSEKLRKIATAFGFRTALQSRYTLGKSLTVRKPPDYVSRASVVVNMWANIAGKLLVTDLAYKGM